jgi:preprotein translocase subunit SecA
MAVFGGGAAPAQAAATPSGAPASLPRSRGQQPGGEVVTVTRSMPKVGRNDPCPCGSGKKYKQCHGQ